MELPTSSAVSQLRVRAQAHEWEYKAWCARIEETENRKALLLMQMHAANAAEDADISNAEKALVAKQLASSNRSRMDVMQTNKELKEYNNTLHGQLRDFGEAIDGLKNQKRDKAPAVHSERRSRSQAIPTTAGACSPESAMQEEEEDDDIAVAIPAPVTRRAPTARTKPKKAKLRQRVVRVSAVQDRIATGGAKVEEAKPKPSPPAATAREELAAEASPVSRPPTIVLDEPSPAPAAVRGASEDAQLLIDLSVPYEPPSAEDTPEEKRKATKRKANPRKNAAEPKPAKPVKSTKPAASKAAAVSSKPVKTPGAVKSEKKSERRSKASAEATKKRKLVTWSGTSLFNSLPPNLLFGENFTVPKLKK